MRWRPLERQTEMGGSGRRQQAWRCNLMFPGGPLEGKRILVAGGGPGLGFSMGKRFLELGASLVICGRRQPVLEQAQAKLAAETGGRVDIHGCDIREADAVERMMEAIWVEAP